ncbi:hypothetical protein [Kitasatospora phosalacinea]|uniref:hypothetical protein n=1 Tax=Kitasatospora phosalacinea TaxID=2065 RepID=UPI000ADEAC22|nr:hypothetical protein [Kitasatospora phosalacinea]
MECGDDRPSPLVREIAEDERVCGLFRVSHEVDGATERQLRDGGLRCVPAPPGHDYLDA